ncbi:MAG: AraC family transcriptional regulator, partial [Phycisphaeraceae bacterium]|nr:AraC family transcriptional regulator [Phycisphaeraceae bacterium]
VVGPAYRPPNAGHDRTDRIDRVCRWARDHATESITAAEAADVASMSPAGFSRLFRQATGRTFTRWLNTVRVGLACRQLQFSDTPITDICFQSGFGNVASFNRWFRREHDCTPSEYRSRFRST